MKIVLFSLLLLTFVGCQDPESLVESSQTAIDSVNRDQDESAPSQAAPSAEKAADIQSLTEQEQVAQQEGQELASAASGDNKQQENPVAPPAKANQGKLSEQQQNQQNDADKNKTQNSASQTGSESDYVPKQRSNTPPRQNLRPNRNWQIQPITEEQFNQQKGKQSLVSYQDFLLEKRHFYQYTNWTEEQRRINEIDQFYTDRKSLEKYKLQEQMNRTTQDRHVTVHMIPHTHDDVGWLKTVDEYFTGAEAGSAHASVKFVLDSILDQLQFDPKRKFTYVEMKYFQMWYKQLDKSKQDQVKKLISTGQLEIAQGGWSATDEAAPSYEDMIINMQTGHQFVQQEFGIRPRVGWMPDAFGHSTANAALFSDFGFESLFIGRMSDEFKEERRDNGELGFIWKPMSKHFGDAKEIYTHLFADSYGTPEHILQYDERADSDPPVQDEEGLQNYNIMHKCNFLVNYVQNSTKWYASKENIVILLGDDFAYMNGFSSFQQNDKLIEDCNKIQKRNMTFVYSTPSMYLDAIKKENVSWPQNYNDFFPYASERYEYWSGFFSSRPALKKQVKSYSSLFHAQSRLFARRMINQKTTNYDINQAMMVHNGTMDVLSVLQHHDGVSGTSTQYVADFYSFKLFESFNRSRSEIGKDISRIIKKMANIDLKANSLMQCADFMQNDTVIDCPIESDKVSKEFLVVAHNQDAMDKEHLIRILLPTSNYMAYLWDTHKNKFNEIDADILEQRHWDKKNAQFSDSVMYFKANISADSIALIKLVKTENSRETQLSQEDVNKTSTLEKSLTLQGMSEQGHVLFKYTNKLQGIEQSFGVNLKKYLAAKTMENVNIEQAGDANNVNTMTDQEKMQVQIAEGAYIFMPAWDDPLPKLFSKITDDVFYQKGKYLEQWTFLFDDKDKNEKAVLRVRFSEMFKDIIEFDVELNPIPISDGRGKDVTVNFKMFNGFDAKGKFWTDSNGLEMQERNVEFIPTNYTFLNDKPYPNYHMISGNFFPVDSAIMMRDHNKSNIQVTVLNDRAQAGTADLTDKSTIELMQHRRILQDDLKGVQEPLNETDRKDHLPIRVNARYYMQIFDTVKGQSLQRQQQIKIEQPLQYFFVSQSNFSIGSAKEIKRDTSQDSAIKFENLSSTVTYRLFPLSRNKVLVRFQNLADLVEKSSEGLSTQFIDLEQFAEDLYMDENWEKANNTEVQEMSLQGVYPIDNDKHKVWWSRDDKSPQLKSLAQDREGFKGIALEPQRMRSFQITYNQPQEALKASVAQKEKVKSTQAKSNSRFVIRDMIKLNSEKFQY